MYLFDLHTYLILDYMTALVRVLSLFARFLNLIQPSSVEDHFPLHTWHYVLGHQLPELRGVHMSSPQSPILPFPIVICWFEWTLVTKDGSKLVQIITDLVVFIGCSF